MARTLLVVDDSPDLREYLVRLFQLTGFDVREAESGSGALEILAGDPLPDLVLLDYMMPGMTGMETLCAMRRDRRTAGVPVVLLSAWDDPAVAAGALAEGATAFWLKGDKKLDEMVAEINRIIDAGAAAVPYPIAAGGMSVRTRPNPTGPRSADGTLRPESMAIDQRLE